MEQQVQSVQHVYKHMHTHPQFTSAFKLYFNKYAQIEHVPDAHLAGEKEFQQNWC
jgi:hypothetical protein